MAFQGEVKHRVEQLRVPEQRMARTKKRGRRLSRRGEQVLLESDAFVAGDHRFGGADQLASLLRIRDCPCRVQDKRGRVDVVVGAAYGTGRDGRRTKNDSCSTCRATWW